MLRRETPPAMLAPRARLVEELGFDAAWVVEDCFWTAGIAAAAVALAATDELGVGIGILPAVLRNPAVAAMELATLAGAWPGRLTAGFGHGVAEWMRQVGAHPESPLAALEETVAAVRLLLDGARVTRQGRHVDLRDVELVFPPAEPVPLVVGVTGPRGLEAAGRATDGVVLPEGSTAAFVREAVARVERARTAEGSPRVVVFAWLAVEDDGAQARAALRPAIAAWIAGAGGRPQLAACSFAAEAERLVAAGGPAAEQVPDAWVEELAVAGTPEACAAAVRALAAAGADTVVLVPPHGDPRPALRRLAQEALRPPAEDGPR
jgi:alkanesulfonate monooxygenase SsuD/methylene tetrahydromethanopterin reductase-like flavin-dependent oxidoreductase (luciferase family)